MPDGALAEARDKPLELGDVDEAEIEGDFLGRLVSVPCR